MKTLLTILIVFSSQTLLAADTASCVLQKFSYVLMSDIQSYVLVGEQKISQTTTRVMNAVDVMKDTVGDTVYSVSVAKGFEGELCIEAGTPQEDCDIDSRHDAHSPLILQVEDVVVGGKLVYQLTCQLD